MKWLLDTNVVSEGIRLRPNRKVVSWVEQHPLDDLAISIVTMAELQDGAASSGPEDRLAQWLEDTVLPSFAERTLPLTLPVLIEWIRLGRRCPRSLYAHAQVRSRLRRSEQSGMGQKA